MAGITMSDHKVITKFTKPSGQQHVADIPAHAGVEDRETLDKLYFTGTKSAINKARKAVLAALCAIHLAKVNREVKDFNSLNRNSLLELVHERVCGLLEPIILT